MGELDETKKELDNMKGNNLNTMKWDKLSELERTLFHSLQIVRVKMNQIHESNQLCVICLDNDKNIVLQPCNHFVFCDECSRDRQDCPLCHANITERISVF